MRELMGCALVKMGDGVVLVWCGHNGHRCDYMSQWLQWW
jgi:hypothetical protein